MDPGIHPQVPGGRELNGDALTHLVLDPRSGSNTMEGHSEVGGAQEEGLCMMGQVIHPGGRQL